MPYQSVAPFDNKLFESFDAITDQQLEQKLAAATACFATWKQTSYAHRARIIARAAEILDEQAEHFAQITSLEMGKRNSEARGEVEFSARILAYYAENAERFLAPEQSNRVIDDPRINGLALTGNVAAARSLTARAKQNLKPSSIEPGGSDAFVVPEDADLEHTVKWAAWGRMYNTGQTRCAAKRFIAVEQVADAFLEKFRAALAALKSGDPMDAKTTLGLLSTEQAILDLLKQVDSAVSHGAKLVLGGKRADRPGAFMQPTTLTDVHPGNPAFRDEFFGPAAMAFRVKDEEAAVALANDFDFGLGGSVFTKDIAAKAWQTASIQQ
ncbi:MAG: aldehyde dehydrogenase family protein [Rhodopila sp.]|jgi:acyl-CoA reductase-like NAD-dependent aldehyde dehydrogenase